MKIIKMLIVGIITLLVTQSAMAMFTLSNDLAKYEIDDYGRVINAYSKLSNGNWSEDLLDVFTIAMAIEGQTIARTPGYKPGTGWVSVPDTTTGVGIGTNYFKTVDIGYYTFGTNPGLFIILRDTKTGVPGVTKSEIYLNYMLVPGKSYLDVRTRVLGLTGFDRTNLYFYVDSAENQVANIQAPTLLKDLPPMYQMDDVSSNWAGGTNWKINTTYAFRIEGGGGGIGFANQRPTGLPTFAGGNNETVWQAILNDGVNGVTWSYSADPAWARKVILTNMINTEERKIDARLEAVMPEPGTILLLTTGVLGLVGLRRKNIVKK